jgi:hypothetical protein
MFCHLSLLRILRLCLHVALVLGLLRALLLVLLLAVSVSRFVVVAPLLLGVLGGTESAMGGSPATTRALGGVRR